MKVSSRINVEIVMVCRSSNHLAFLMSESGLCCDLSTATVRNIATTRVKVSPTGTTGTGKPAFSARYWDASLRSDGGISRPLYSIRSSRARASRLI